MPNNSLIIQLHLSTLRQKMEELVMKELQPETFKAYQKLDKERKLVTQALGEGWESFDWGIAHEEGWLTNRDYEIFEELKGLDPDYYLKKKGLL